MMLSTQLKYQGGLWCHHSISYGNRSFKDSKTRLPAGIVNTLQHTLAPQSSIGSVESVDLDRGPSGNNSSYSSLEQGEKRRTAAAWEPGRHLPDLRCLLHDPSGNWVGAGSLSSVCLCVFVIMTDFLRKLNFFPLKFLWWSATAFVTVIPNGSIG